MHVSIVLLRTRIVKTNVFWPLFELFPMELFCTFSSNQSEFQPSLLDQCWVCRCGKVCPVEIENHCYIVFIWVSKNFVDKSKWLLAQSSSHSPPDPEPIENNMQ